MTAISASALYKSSTNLTGSSSAAASAPTATDTPATNKDAAATATGGTPAVVVSLSSQAQSALAAGTDASTSYYAQFFPTRDGSPATALALAVTDPGVESSSSGKSLAQVAADARASMDAEYAKMQASGKPFDPNSLEGKDWYSVMGNLDRRSLYAVSANIGGKFTQQEQDMAQSIMQQQQGLAMGLYSGPTRLAGSFVDPYANDNAARDKAGVKFLDGVSNDEKTSIAWAVSRASAQTAYEWVVQGEGKTPENLDSENPLAKLIQNAMRTMADNLQRSHSVGEIKTADDLRRQPWFQGFEGQLDKAIQQTQAMYQTKTQSAA